MDIKKTTGELLELLKNTDKTIDLENYIADIPDSLTLVAYLNQLMIEKKLDKSKIIQSSNIQRTYGYQIFDGRKQPGKDKVIALALAMNLTLDETQRILTLSGNSILYAKNKRDSIIIFGINKGLSVMEVNDLLYEMKESTIE